MLDIRNASICIGQQVLIRNLSMSFKPGKLYFIIGPNGCGKSTLVRTLLGLRPTPRDVFFWEGDDVATFDFRKRASLFSLVKKQDAYALDIPVMDYVALGMLSHRMWYQVWSSYTEDERIQAALSKAACRHLSTKLISHLSDGERQLVEYARVLCQDTRVVVADEPAAHLDYLQRQKLYLSLGELARNESKICIVVSHDLDYALQLADELLVFDGLGSTSLMTPGSTELSAFLEKVFGKRCE